MIEKKFPNMTTSEKQMWDKFWVHFENQWIRKKSVLDAWHLLDENGDVKEMEGRTNNGIERYNRHMNELIPAHPSIPHFVKVLKQEAADQIDRVKNHEDGHTDPNDRLPLFIPERPAKYYTFKVTDVCSKASDMQTAETKGMNSELCCGSAKETALKLRVSDWVIFKSAGDEVQPIWLGRIMSRKGWGGKGVSKNETLKKKQFNKGGTQILPGDIALNILWYEMIDDVNSDSPLNYQLLSTKNRAHGTKLPRFSQLWLSHALYQRKKQSRSSGKTRSHARRLRSLV